jgi:hypothetical protein
MGERVCSGVGAVRAEALILVARNREITGGDHAKSGRTEQVSQDSLVAHIDSKILERKSPEHTHFSFELRLHLNRQHMWTARQFIPRY